MKSGTHCGHINAVILIERLLNIHEITYSSMDHPRCDISEVALKYSTISQHPAAGLGMSMQQTLADAFN